MEKYQPKFMDGVRRQILYIIMGLVAPLARIFLKIDALRFNFMAFSCSFVKF